MAKNEAISPVSKKPTLVRVADLIVELAVSISMAAGMVLLVILAVFTTLNVILRALGVMTYGFYEIILLLIVAFVLTGGAGAEKDDQHLRLDVISARFSRKTQAFLRTGGLLLGVVFSGIMLWRLVIYTYSLYQDGSHYKGMVNLPYWPAYTVMTLSYIAFVVILLAHFIKSVRENVDYFR